MSAWCTGALPSALFLRYIGACSDIKLCCGQNLFIISHNKCQCSFFSTCFRHSAGDREQMSDRIVLTLFIAGTGERAQRAREELAALREALPPGCEVRIVDVLEEPVAAAAHQVLAVPTLVLEQRGIERRVIGDLSDVRAVLQALELLQGSGR